MIGKQSHKKKVRKDERWKKGKRSKVEGDRQSEGGTLRDSG